MKFVYQVVEVEGVFEVWYYEIFYVEVFKFREIEIFKIVYVKIFKVWYVELQYWLLFGCGLLLNVIWVRYDCNFDWGCFQILIVYFDVGWFDVVIVNIFGYQVESVGELLCGVFVDYVYVRGVIGLVYYVKVIEVGCLEVLFLFVFKNEVDLQYIVYEQRIGVDFNGEVYFILLSVEYGKVQ